MKEAGGCSLPLLQCERQVNARPHVRRNHSCDSCELALFVFEGIGELQAQGFRRTYSLLVADSRCLNNYGSYQFPDKLMPLMIANPFNDEQAAAPDGSGGLLLLV